MRRLFLLGLILAVAITAVGTSTTPSSYAQDSSSAIIIGMTDLPTTLDPSDAYDFVAWEVLSHLYTGLTRQTPGTTNYELALADTVTVSEDKLTYTFTLKDSTFSDSTPITAQTFVDSINRVMTLDRSAAKAVTPYIESVEASDKGELIFHLKYPVPYFLGLVALPPYFPQHPTLINSGQPVPIPDQIIGNGPYVMEELDYGTQYVLQANPAYTLGPAPVTSTIILKGFSRSQDMREALRAHEIDIAWRSLFLGDLLDLEGTEGINVVKVPSTRVFYAYMSHDLEPFDDPLVREAITVLLSRQGLVDNVFHGNATPLTSMIPEIFPDAYAPIWPDESDIPRAEETLREAAYSIRGQGRLELTIVLSQPTYGDVYAAAAAELNRDSFSNTDFINSGLYTDIQTMAFIQALERGEGEKQLVLFAWTPIVPHPDAYLRPLSYSTSTIPDHGRYGSEEIDALLDQAALSDDPAASGEQYQDVSRLLLDNFDIAPLWEDQIQLLAWDNISGIQVEPNYFLHYDLLKKQ